jgi:hypothetical protein
MQAIIAIARGLIANMAAGAPVFRERTNPVFNWTRTTEPQTSSANRPCFIKVGTVRPSLFNKAMGRKRGDLPNAVNRAIGGEGLHGKTERGDQIWFHSEKNGQSL